MTEITEDVVIVGAGIAGLTTCLGLHRLGLKSLVLERSDSLRISGFGLTISTNAWRALDAVGIGDYLRKHHLQIQQLQGVSLKTGDCIFKIPFTKRGKHGNLNEIRCVKRKSLLEALEKELPQGSVRFSSKIVYIEESGPYKLLHLVDGSIVKAKVVIGCDGVKSLVSSWLDFEKPVSISRAAVRGLAEFRDGHGLEPQFWQYYGEGVRYGYVPCDDKTVYWFFTFTPYYPEDFEDVEGDPAKIKQFVLSKLVNVTPKSKEVIQKTELHALLLSPIKLRWPWDTFFGNISKGKVCVAGDALHPMTPDIGQGGCSALEDAVVLARCLAGAMVGKSHVGGEEEEEGDEGKRIENGLEKYAKERRWRVTLISSISCFLGFIQQSDGLVMRLFRKLFSRFLLNQQLKLLDYDCGKLV